MVRHTLNVWTYVDLDRANVPRITGQASSRVRRLADAVMDRWVSDRTQVGKVYQWESH